MRPGELLREAAERLRGLGPIPVLEAARLLVLGDTHGYPEVTRWALELADEESVDAVVLLGDYVDRGPGGVENLELIAEQLLSRGPHHLLPLRGNHEDLEMNAYYGFRDEALEKRGRGYLEAVEKFYASLPLVARAGPVALLHGGPACRECVAGAPPLGLDELRTVLGELWGREDAAMTAHPILLQLLWNDPRGTIEWYLPSPRGPGIYLYGCRAWKTFLERSGLGILVRGHEAVDGVDVWLGSCSRALLRGEARLEDLEGSVVTVFSSLYHGASAAALLLDLGEGVARVYIYKSPG